MSAITKLTSSLLRTSRCLCSASKSLSDQAPIRVTLNPGDGVGPELMQSVKVVFKAAGVPVEFDEHLVSEIQRRATPKLLGNLIESIKKNKVALMGDIASPISDYGGELDAVKSNIKKELDLFANVVRVKSLPGLETRHNNLDIVIIREQTEGEYTALEHETVPGVVECLKIITHSNSYNIAKFAFDYATKHGRKKVTAVHKANIMKLCDGMFIAACKEVSELYPQIEYETMIVDNTCMQLVINPYQFDVMVMPNLYGNIIDNAASGLVGGAGVVPGESFSNEYAVFETGARHTFAQAIGRDSANPTAMLLAAAHMLKHLRLDNYGIKIEEGVKKVIADGKVRTRDMKGYSTTSEFTAAVIDAIHNSA